MWITDRQWAVLLALLASASAFSFAPPAATRFASSTPQSAILNRGHRFEKTLHAGLSMAFQDSAQPVQSAEQINNSKKESIPAGFTGNSDTDSAGIGSLVAGFHGLDPVWVARIILITVSAFYGTNFGCVKILGSALHPAVAAAFRFSIASLVFLPYLIKAAQRNRAVVLGGVEVGVYCAIGYIGQAISLLSSRASNVAFICSLAVVVVPILESLFGEKKGTGYLKTAIFPALMAAAGVGCLELGGTSPPALGDLWAFLQPLFFGLGFWRIERHMKVCTEPGDAQAFTGAMMGVVAIFSYLWAIQGFVIPVSRYGDEIFWTSITSQITALFNDWRVPAALAWTGIVTTALTSFGENLAMKKLDAAESTVIYSTEPLWGTAFAAVTLHETIGWNTGIGAVLVLAACIWSSLGARISSSLSTSTLLAFEGYEEILENISVNIMKILEGVPFD